MQKGAFFWQLNKAVMNGEADNIGSVLEKLIPLGLSFVDVGSVDINEKRGPKELLFELNKYGIYIASLYYITNFDDDSIDLKELNKRMLDLCANLDCKLLMPVPRVKNPNKSDVQRQYWQDKIIDYLCETISQSDEYGINITLENFSDLNTPFSTIDDIKYILDKLPGISYTLDTGNFWFAGNDAVVAAKKFSERISHVHLKDILPKSNGFLNINGKSCDSVAIGDGKISFTDIFNVLKKNGFDKTFSIEINSNTDLLEKTIKSLMQLQYYK